MTLPVSALPVDTPPAFLGVSHSATGKLWRDRLDARGAVRALAINEVAPGVLVQGPVPGLDEQVHDLHRRFRGTGTG